jgi:hypothetical protein
VPVTPRLFLPFDKGRILTAATTSNCDTMILRFLPAFGTAQTAKAGIRKETFLF